MAEQQKEEGFPMIFENGELRPVVNSKPKLFDGWDYVPIELDPVADDTRNSPTESDMSVIPVSE